MKGSYNKPFEPTDTDFINQSHTAIELKGLVDELTERKLMTTASGNHKYSNLNENIKYQYTLHPMRLWEYTRVFEICGLQRGMKVLDGGGCKQPNNFLLWKKGNRYNNIRFTRTLDRKHERGCIYDGMEYYNCN